MKVATKEAVLAWLDGLAANGHAEKRALIAVVENLWDKYAVSSRELEQSRGEILKELDGYLRGLVYVS